MSAKLNLFTVVDKFCQRRVFFPLEKLLKASRLLNTANFRLLKIGNVFTDRLTAEHFSAPYLKMLSVFH